MILDLFLARRAIGVPDLARVGISEDRLDPRRDIPGQKRGRPGRSDRSQATVAQAMLGDQRACLVVERSRLGRSSMHESYSGKAPFSAASSAEAR